MDVSKHERTRWAFRWWKALELAGANAWPEGYWFRMYDESDIVPMYYTETGYERASMWLDGAPIEALP